MEKLTINVPEGHEIDIEKSDLTKGEVYFKPVVKKDLSWEEIQKLKDNSKTLQYFPGACCVLEYCFKDKTNVNYTQNHLPTKRIAEKILALCQLHIIAEYYNEGWEPDWNNSAEVKWAFIVTGKQAVDFIPYHTTSIGYEPYFKTRGCLMRAYNANKEIFETALKP